MKYLMLFSVIIFSISTSTFGQSDDTQWFIKNNNYRNDNAIGINYGLLSNPSPQSLKFQNIRPLCTECNPGKAYDDDILIIFDDGTHYNSRLDRVSNQHYIWEYNGNNFDLESNRGIEYLYWTNKYDDDDPPPLTTVLGLTSNSNKVSLNQNNNITPGSLFKESNLPVISANHDVVHGKDITIIINNRGLKDPVTIEFNQIKQSDTNQSIADATQGVFAGSAVFENDQFGYPKDPVLLSNQNRLTYNINGAPFTYINLRPTNYLKDNFKKNEGHEDPEVLFTLTDNSIYTNSSPYLHKEAIRYAHDPNYLRALSFCIMDTDTFVLYEGQFQNNGDAYVENPNVDFTLPSNLRFNDVKICNVRFGGSVYDMNNASFVQTSSKLDLDFVEKLRGCAENQSPSYEESLVKFNLCIGPLPDGFDPNIHEYLIDTATVFFNNTPLGMRIEDMSKNVTYVMGNEGVVNLKKVKFLYEDCNLCGPAVKDDETWAKNYAGTPYKIQDLILEILEIEDFEVKKEQLEVASELAKMVKSKTDKVLNKSRFKNLGVLKY